MVLICIALTIEIMMNIMRTVSIELEWFVVIVERLKKKKMIEKCPEIRSYRAL